MKGLADYIENEMKFFPDDDVLLEFETKMLENGNALEKRVRHAGLSDEKVIFDLIKDSYQDMRVQYTEYRKKRLKELREKKLRELLMKGTPVDYLIMVAVYLLVSFITKNWAQSWLIIIAFVTVWVDTIAVVTGIQIASRRKIFHPIARVVVALAVMMTTTFIYLTGLIMFRIPRFWVMFPAGVFVMFWTDALYAFLTRQRMRIINYLLYIPASVPMIYVFLAGKYIIPWHPGWIIIPLSLLIDLAIIIARLIHNRKYKYRPGEED